MEPSIYFLHGINAEPWTAPSVSVGRRGGRAFPQVYKSEALKTYQAAVADALRVYHPPLIDTDDEGNEIDLAVQFLVWRWLPDYETERTTKGGDGARARKHVADSTNIQKALEDACQGILFKNDRQVKRVTTEIVDQDYDTDPTIVIIVEPYRPNQAEIAARVTAGRAQAPAGADVGAWTKPEASSRYDGLDEYF